jgi:hypothetical protein
VVTPQFLCALPFGWSTYVVQPGDTLYAIALASGTSVEVLRDANCIASVAMLPVGLPVYVPIALPPSVEVVVPVMPPITPAPGVLQVPTNLQPQGCDSDAARITSPVPGQVIDSVVSVFGSAGGENFSRFELAVRPASRRQYSVVETSPVPVFAGALGQVNAGFFGEGIHWVRVTSYDASGQAIARCAIPVIFR